PVSQISLLYLSDFLFLLTDTKVDHQDRNDQQRHTPEYDQSQDNVGKESAFQIYQYSPKQVKDRMKHHRYQNAVISVRQPAQKESEKSRINPLYKVHMENAEKDCLN